MDSHQRGVAPGDITMNESDRLRPGARIRIGDGVERPDAGRQARVAQSADAGLCSGLAFGGHEVIEQRQCPSLSWHVEHDDIAG
jgi:hypothetical protein